MQKPMNNAAMIRLLDKSISQFANPGSHDVNEEHLALICMGRIDELSAAERFVLLRQIAADPELAQLVAQMREMGWGEDEHPAATFPDIILRITPIAWSMAACLAVALGVWRFAIAPSNSTNTTVAMKTGSGGGSALPLISNPLGGPNQSPTAGGNNGRGGSKLGTAQTSANQNPTTAPTNTLSALRPIAPVQNDQNLSNPPPTPDQVPIAQNAAAKNSWQMADWLAISAVFLAAILTLPGIYWLVYLRRRRTIAP